MLKFKSPSFGRGAPKEPSEKSKIHINMLFAQSGQREAWWPLDESKMLLTDHPTASAPDNCVALSFSRYDYCASLTSTSQSAQIRDLVSDIGEDLAFRKIQVEKSSKSDSDSWKNVKAPWLYASTKSRLDVLPETTMVVSGYSAIRALLSKSEAVQHMETPFLTGFFFEGNGTNSQILILMLCHDDGRLTNLDYIPINGTDPENAIKSFVQSARLSSDGEWDAERQAIFPGISLNDVAHIIKTYPREEEIAGISVKVISKITAILSLAGVIGVASAAGYYTYLNHEAKNSANQSSSSKAIGTRNIVSEISGPKMGAYLAKRSTDISQAIVQAGKFWVEGSVVSIDATREILKLTMKYPMSANEGSTESVARALTKSTPEGCERMPVSTNPQITELTITYECQTSDTLLRRIADLHQ